MFQLKYLWQILKKVDWALVFGAAFYATVVEHSFPEAFVGWQGELLTLLLIIQVFIAVGAVRAFIRMWR